MASSSSQTAGWQIPDGAKFAILAVKTSCLPAARDGELVLADGVRVLFRPPIPMPDLWKKWLGSLRSDQFQESNFVVVVSERSETPGVLDAQTKRLEMRANDIFLGVLLQGSPLGFSGIILFSGELRGGELEVRAVTNLQPVHRVAGSKAFLLSDAMIRDAPRVAVALRDRVMAGGFRRLRVGFASWRGAVLEVIPAERLHGFVRSLDGVMILPKGSSQKVFRKRGQILLGQSAANEQLLDELYELRSAASHLNDVEEILAAYPLEGRNMTACLRCFQAELLAREVYRRILSTDELLERMKDDDSIKKLWELGDAELRRLWGSPIDLDGPCRARFIDTNTGAFPEARLVTRTPGGSASAAPIRPRRGTKGSTIGA